MAVGGVGIFHGNGKHFCDWNFSSEQRIIYFYCLLIFIFIYVWNHFKALNTSIMTFKSSFEIQKIKLPLLPKYIFVTQDNQNHERANALHRITCHQKKDIKVRNLNPARVSITEITHFCLYLLKKIIISIGL